ncbi:MAG: YifB family Mg chelatase-like AAA ATPase [Pirellulaceae bacterium]
MPSFNLHDHLLRRDHTLLGGIVVGIDGVRVEIQARATEVHKRGPQPFADSCRVTGMARGPVRESLDRISGAFSKLGIADSPVQILINLAPAAVEKDGAWLDLPLAIIMLQCAGVLPDLPSQKESSLLLFGEIGIHGELRRVPGALSLGFTATPGQSVIVPTGNEKECALIMAKPGHEGCRVFVAKTLEDVISFFRGEQVLPNALKQKISFEPAIEKAVDFGRIRGQELAKRAAVISAAGGHNLLLSGPPGEGKSLIASAIPGILPPMSDAAKVEVTKIYSACGMLEHDGMAVTRRPFRSIHHSITMPALVGGGAGVPKPGEITLSHHGVLFLDEFPEFSRQALESLRQPLEAGQVTITRVGATLTFPAHFTLVAAMNPCPCGYADSDRCTCTTSTISRYMKKLSGPLLDRLDLQVNLKPLTADERFSETTENESPRLRKIVADARQKQVARFEGTKIPCNSFIPGGHLPDFCKFTPQAFEQYKQLASTTDISTRSADRLAKVARTIADLDAEPKIDNAHVEEAASFIRGGILTHS